LQSEKRISQMYIFRWNIFVHCWSIHLNCQTADLSYFDICLSKGSKLFEYEPVAVWNYWVSGYKRIFDVLQNNFGSFWICSQNRRRTPISLVTINSVVQHGNRWRYDPTESR
jgi:hypothetical protein